MISFRRREATERIILHASHTTPEQPGITAFLTVEGRRRGLLEIGYHYVIDTSGKAICTKPDDTVGNHAHGHNGTSIGVCLAGGAGPEGEPLDTFTPDQMDNLVLLIGYLRKNYGPVPVVGHSELGWRKHRGRPCPPIDMDNFRRRL